MQINRLFEIIYILLDKKNVTADELAQRFEVSRRTIYRDIELLSQAGIPIYTNRGKNGGISILDNFILNKAVISDKEQSAIITALAAMATLPNVEKTGIESRLSSLFRKDSVSWINVDFSDWNIDSKNLFDTLKDAVVEKRVLKLDYVNSNGKTSCRDVEPLQLWFKGKTWYLMAYCKKAEDYRVFRLSRIRGITVSDERFEREIPSDMYDDGDYNIETTEVIMKINPRVKYRVYDEFRDIEKTDDGYYIVKMNYPENEWLYGHIMSFGENAEVISPERIRNIIKEKFANSLKIYL